MRIGLTYDLRQDYLKLGFGEEETAEFDQIDTVTSIEQTLEKLGHAPDRIGNIWQLTKRLANGDTWDLVFNIAEGLRGSGREAQVPALLDAYNIPYTFSGPLVMALTLHKGMTKRVLRDLGIPTPNFVEVRSEADIELVALPFPLFAKPIAEGTGKGVTAASKIHTKAELQAVCSRLLATYNQPVLVETFLPGREFTVGIVGSGCESKSVGVVEVVLKDGAEKDVYSYVNKERCEEFVGYLPVDDAMAKIAVEIALSAWRALGCLDAGRLDLRSNEPGIPNLMEVNPLAGIHPHHSDLPIICQLNGISYEQLFTMILDSASKRVRSDESHERVDALEEIC